MNPGWHAWDIGGAVRVFKAIVSVVGLIAIFYLIKVVVRAIISASSAEFV